jgi:hypothetical protein
MSEQTIYHETLVGASDVCRNCLRIRLVERIEVRSRGLTATPESTYTRHRRTTSLGHHPSDEPTDDKHLFCDCGAPDARTRTWGGGHIDRERYKTLLRRAIRAAEHKGVTLDRERTIKMALRNLAIVTAWWRSDIDSVDDALADALEYGSAAATVQADDAQAAAD